jgi:hypothetical protein
MGIYVEETCLSLWGNRLKQDQNRQEKFHKHGLKRVYEHQPERSSKTTQDKKEMFNIYHNLLLCNFYSLALSKQHIQTPLLQSIAQTSHL